jgi:hypothetical protein
MASDDGVLAAARAIRPYLAQLVGPNSPLLDQQIADLLNDPPGEAKAAGQLRVLLEAGEDTRWFLAEVLRDAPDYRPPYHQPRYLRQSGGTGLPAGDPGPVLHAGAYRCPREDYDWYRPSIGTRVPDCPTHKIPLDRI